MPHYKATPKQTAVKAPDEFISAIDHLVCWVAANRRVISALLMVGVLGAVVFLGLGFYQEKKLTGFADRYYQLSQKDFPQTELAQLLADYGGEPVAQLAQTKLIWKAVQNKEWDQAIELINKNLSSLPIIVQPLWKFNLAKLYWIKNQKDVALTTLDELDESTYLGEQVAWVRAQILESQGKIEEALVLYQELGLGEDGSVKKLAQLKRILLSASPTEPGVNP